MSGDSNGHDEGVCTTCHQALPGATPYRGANPIDESDDSTFGELKARMQMAWWYLQENCPAPLKWMGKSLGWVLVGSVVVSVGMGVSYFMIRYLLWALIVMLGKWLLDRIGRGIPRVVDGLSIGTPHTAFGYWEVGVLGVVAIVIAACVGRLVMRWLKNRGAK